MNTFLPAEYEWIVWRRPNGTCFYDTIFSQSENKGEKVVGVFIERDDAKLFCAFMSDADFCKKSLDRIGKGGRLNVQISICDAAIDPIDLSKIPIGGIVEIKKWSCVCGYEVEGIRCTHCGRAWDNPERAGLSTSQTEAAKK